MLFCWPNVISVTYLFTIMIYFYLFWAYLTWLSVMIQQRLWFVFFFKAQQHSPCQSHGWIWPSWLLVSLQLHSEQSETIMLKMKLVSDQPHLPRDHRGVGHLQRRGWKRMHRWRKGKTLTERSVLMALLPHRLPFHSQLGENFAQPGSEMPKPLPVDQEVCLWPSHQEAPECPAAPESLDFEAALQLWMLAWMEEHQAGVGGYSSSHWQGVWLA